MPSSACKTQKRADKPGDDRSVGLLVLFFFLHVRRPARSPLFPYTTLFRSSATICAPVSVAMSTSASGSSSAARTIASARTSRPSASVLRTSTRFPPYWVDRKSTRLNSSHPSISYAVFCLQNTKKSRQARRRPLSRSSRPVFFFARAPPRALPPLSLHDALPI